MRRRAWLLIPIAALTLAACLSDEEAFELAPGSASCAARVDHERALCPMYSGDRAEDIMYCEADRLDEELTGCDEQHARFVLCLTEASGYDCEEGPTDCYDELDQLQLCRQRFAQGTGCSRVPRDDVCVGQPQPYSFNCIGDGPTGCGPDNREQTEAQEILNVGFRCCPSFARDDVSYFADPEL